MTVDEVAGAFEDLFTLSQLSADDFLSDYLGMVIGMVGGFA